MAKKVHGAAADLQPLVQRLFDAANRLAPLCTIEGCAQYAPLSLRYGTEPDYRRGVDTGRYRCRFCAPDRAKHIRVEEHDLAGLADALNEALLWVAD